MNRRLYLKTIAATAVAFAVAVGGYYFYSLLGSRVQSITDHIISNTSLTTGIPNMNPQDVATPEGMPAIGKWMLKADLSPANWLGLKYKGKNLKEPINILIVDDAAVSSDDARLRLEENAERAGYEKRSGHTGGYVGYIGGLFFTQLPAEKDHAFSNAPMITDNNHGRVFGPLSWDSRYYFTGAFSRETIDPLGAIKHHYASFNQARDHFAETLDRKTNYKIMSHVDLGNAVDDDKETTGDHDGKAVLIWARR